MGSRDNLGNEKTSGSESSDAEATAMVKKEHPGWVDDPIAGLSEVAQVFEEKTGMIASVVGISTIVGELGIILSFFPLLFAILDGDIGEIMVFGAVFLVFLFIFVNGIRSLSIIEPLARRVQTLSMAFRFDPETEIPQGKDRIDRFLNHLKTADGRFAKSLSKVPHKLRLGAVLRGRSGKTHEFDAFMYDTGGWKRSRYLIAVKLFDQQISRSVIQAYKNELEDVFERMKKTPTRVFAIQREGEFDEETLEFVDAEWIVWKASPSSSRWRGVPIEVLRETEKGTYEFGIFYFG